VHFKECAPRKAKRRRARKTSETLDGLCDWPEVIRALRDIGFSGWVTAEIAGGDRKRLQEIARRIDAIFAS
jgi:hexulose-6-phosphate isomerase